MQHCVGRQEALRSWQRNLGLKATYGKLFELFVQAGHSQCAEALCEVLRKRCGLMQGYTEHKAMCVVTTCR